MALVDLYISTDGANWFTHFNWLSTEPLGNWYGVTVTNGRVNVLNLRANQISGKLPISIGNLTALTLLDLSFNNLTGDIPTSLGNLKKLLQLHLSSNQLSDTIPSSIGDLPLLTWLHLTGNQLSGSIPSSIGNLADLQRLELAYNQLSGSIPLSFDNLFNLKYCYLRSNHLTGSIPAFLGNHSNLNFLDLSSNLLTGDIPSSLGNLSNVYNLYLGDNKISGTIPATFGNLSNLYYLYLANNQIGGSIPSSIGNLTNLVSLGLANNRLTGPIPSSIKALPNLQNINLDNNRFVFDGLEEIVNQYSSISLTYAPQANIILNQFGEILSVSAGGALSNDTFRLYKDGILSGTQIGDSNFVITGIGAYYVKVTNVIATQLTLYSDTLFTASVFTSVADGNWNDPAIWSGGIVPSSNAPVIIKNTVTVTTNTTCYSLKVESPGGNLVVSSGAHLTVTH
jgi:hypothetical protein